MSYRPTHPYIDIKNLKQMIESAGYKLRIIQDYFNLFVRYNDFKGDVNHD